MWDVRFLRGHNVRKIVLGLIFGVAALFSAAGWCQQTVVSPFPPNSVLAAGQGGTQLDPTAQAANYALVTTGNPQTPYAFVLLPAVPGSVTTVSCATANGFACTVATPTTTPVLTLKTTITGILKGNGTAESAAVSGTDYAPATSGSAVLKGNAAGGFAAALNSDLPAMSATVGGAVPTPPNNTTTFLRGDGTFAAPSGGSGTVTSVSVVSANGLGGSVATATSTPAITLTTSVSGIAKGNGTALSAAVSGTDYAPATSGSALLAGNAAGGFATPTSSTIGAAIEVITTTPVTPASATPSPSGLSVTMVAAGTYTFEAFLYVTNTSTFTVSLNSGTVTATSITGIIEALKSATDSNTIISSLSTTSGVATAVAGFRIHGSIVVNAGGTFVPGVATAPASPDLLNAGSWMRVTRIN
jgi:hypothetical protein